MDNLRAIYLIIISKSIVLILSLIAGAAVGYFLGSMYIGISVFALVLFILYWNFIGPMHRVTKNQISALIDQEVLIDSYIKPYSRDIELFNLNKEDWFCGGGVIDRFTDLYKTQHNNKGILLYNMDIPYLPIYILPWNNIKDIDKNTDFVKQNNIHHVEDTLEVALINGGKILLPLSPSTVSDWYARKETR